MYTIHIARKAEKSLSRIPKLYYQRIRKKIAFLAFNPFIGKKLEGHYADCYSIRVWPYRIIYSIVKNKLIVEVIEIDLPSDLSRETLVKREALAKLGHRGRAYRK